MRYPHLAARIFNTPLLIHPQKLDAIIAGIGPRLLDVAGEQLHIQSEASSLPAELFSTKKGVANQERGYKIVDGVAVINISGVTVHRSRMETMSSMLLGYNDITTDVEHAMDNPDVHAILRVYDSPGGESSGAFEHADRMREMLGKKPMVSIADCFACSAAYLAGSAADEFVVSRTGYAGSIGVVMRHMDMSRALALEGVNVTQIYAGSHKVDGNPFNPLPESVRADFQEEVDGLYEMFIETVALNRRISAEALRNTQADVYRGQKAVTVGLADRVSTTDNLIAELAARRTAHIHSMPASATREEVSAGLSGQQIQTANPISTKGATAMNLDELRTAHPDLCAALVEEGRVAGFAAGAVAESQRIKDVEAQAVPGHEVLINTLKYDGKTTGPEAAVQVIAADKKAGSAALGIITGAAPGAAAFAAAPDAEAEAAAKAAETAALPIEERAKAIWETDANIRSEFTNFESYMAFEKANASGQVKILNRKG